MPKMGVLVRKAAGFQQKGGRFLAERWQVSSRKVAGFCVNTSIKITFTPSFM